MSLVSKIREDVPLAPLTTFGIGGAARYFVTIQTPAEIESALQWAEKRDLSTFVLGGGSNLLVSDAGFPGLVLQVQIAGINHLGSNLFAVGAGESWDEFVSYAVQNNLAGIECLAGIPGSIGGTPVQNVGAYGQEVSETIAAVHFFDRESKSFLSFDNADCHFRYRESRFNTDEPNRYIVHRVDFKLVPDGAPRIQYADLQRRFAQASAPPSLVETANAVRDIRRSKGMLLVAGDPDCRSAGSFFKNPVVTAHAVGRIAAELKIASSEVPNWPADGGKIKLPAAWLLERAGFKKGYAEGPAAISSRHTLALTNRGGATCADILRLQDRIVATVRERFGIQLEREPVLLG
jgi:UDP-N-acetylmuramate dehydrogenase